MYNGSPFSFGSEWSAIEPEIGDTLQQAGHQMDR